MTPGLRTAGMSADVPERISFAGARKYLATSGREFVEYFRHGSLTAELYSPKGTDKQTPHDRDEIYVVASGSGTFTLEGATTPFTRGDVLFVPARKKHRFTRFTKDFSTWVFFYGPVNGEQGTVRNILVKHGRTPHMAQLKTARNRMSVTEFLKTVKDPVRTKECKTLLAMMKKATGEKPSMWGTSIVGFGSYHYRYASGREGDWFLTGFSPRKQNLTLYIMSGFGKHASLLKELGKFKTGVSCLYIGSLADVRLPTLRTLITTSVREMQKRS
jgi:mannose-6-phosphate isomerase-like protein (cupin superfamily)